MDDGGPTASLILFIVLLLLNSFFHGFGAALRALNWKELTDKAEGGGRKAGRLLRMTENPLPFVDTLQLIVTAIHITMGGVCLPMLAGYFHNVWITAVVMLILVLSVGILIPKRMAAKYADRFAYLFVNPVYVLMLVLSPLTGAVSLLSGLVLRLFGIRMDEQQEDVTEEEIISMVNEGHEQGVLQASEAEMITNIFEYGDKEAEDIMTHRKNIVAVDAKMPLREAVEFMLNNSNSRYPVYEENIDHIIGILHMKDIMRTEFAFRTDGGDQNRPICEIEGLIREAKFIPPTRNIDILFQNMQSQKVQMVIVVDEYGQTLGLVAMEDILEEIVGNILDEYDEDTGYIRESSEGQYEIDGMTPLEELEEKLQISFQEEEFDTLNGFMISRLDKIPETEDEQFEVMVGDYAFRVLSVQDKMIRTVLVTKLAGESDRQEEAGGDLGTREAVTESDLSQDSMISPAEEH